MNLEMLFSSLLVSPAHPSGPYQCLFSSGLGPKLSWGHLLLSARQDGYRSLKPVLLITNEKQIRFFLINFF